MQYSFIVQQMLKTHKKLMNKRLKCVKSTWILHIQSDLVWHSTSLSFITKLKAILKKHVN